MQSVLIIFIVILVVMMMIQIDHLRGTARVINYAGLVRGATQREIKLEITGTQNDELIQYLDDIISGLRYQDGHYDLIRLKDETYREKLDVQSAYWEQLKEEIADVRQKGYENTGNPATARFAAIMPAVFSSGATPKTTITLHKEINAPMKRTVFFNKSSTFSFVLAPDTSTTPTHNRIIMIMLGTSIKLLIGNSIPTVQIPKHINAANITITPITTDIFVPFFVDSFSFTNAIIVSSAFT